MFQQNSIYLTHTHKLIINTVTFYCFSGHVKLFIFLIVYLYKCVCSDMIVKRNIIKSA